MSANLILCNKDLSNEGIKSTDPNESTNNFTFAKLHNVSNLPTVVSTCNIAKNTTIPPISIINNKVDPYVIELDDVYEYRHFSVDNGVISPLWVKIKIIEIIKNFNKENILDNPINKDDVFKITQKLLNVSQKIAFNAKIISILNSGNTDKEIYISEQSINYGNLMPLGTNIINDYEFCIVKSPTSRKYSFDD